MNQTFKIQVEVGNGIFKFQTWIQIWNSKSINITSEFCLPDWIISICLSLFFIFILFYSCSLHKNVSFIHSIDTSISNSITLFWYKFLEGISWSWPARDCHFHCTPFHKIQICIAWIVNTTLTTFIWMSYFYYIWVLCLDIFLSHPSYEKFRATDLINSIVKVSKQSCEVG